MSEAFRSVRRPLTIAAMLVVLDQVTKVLVKGFDLFGIVHEGMFLGESRPLLGDALRLTFVENPGMAFGIEWGNAKIILTLLTIGIVLLIVRMIMQTPESARTVRFSLTLLLGGAVGNLIDRMFYGVLYGEGPLFYGKVVDFLQVDIPDVSLFGELYTHWPVFNVADSCVSVGVVTLLIASMISDQNVPLFGVRDEKEG
ncbi:MAG: signal peptidase II [Bacteroidota bacterium]